MKQRICKRLMAFLLCMAMLFTMFPQEAYTAFAKEESDVAETENTTEDTVSEETSEDTTTSEETSSEESTTEEADEETSDSSDSGGILYKIQDAVSNIASSVQSLTESEDNSSDESDSSEDTETEVEDEDESLSESEDDSSSVTYGDDYQLLVKGDVDTEEECVIGEYEDVYLVSYGSEDEMLEAYEEYTEAGALVDVNETNFGTADNDDESGDAYTIDYEGGEDPLSILSDAEIEEVETEDDDDLVIALIDTGASEEYEYIDAVSVVDDSPYDSNGHGTSMAFYIFDMNPNAQILSIKAFGSDGKADPASIYAAIQYAVEAGADIINMSFSAKATENNSVVADAIEEAAESGIIMVGAAGNNNSDASGYVPGGIESAYVIGARNNDYTKQEDSNYGDTVDGYAVGSSTSQAAAIISALFSKGFTFEEMLENNAVVEECALEEWEVSEEDSGDSSDESFYTSYWSGSGYSLSGNAYSVTLNIGASVEYNGWSTHYYSVTGTTTSGSSVTSTAFCVNANASSPGSVGDSLTKTAYKATLQASCYSSVYINSDYDLYSFTVSANSVAKVIMYAIENGYGSALMESANSLFDANISTASEAYAYAHEALAWLITGNPYDTSTVAASIVNLVIRAYGFTLTEVEDGVYRDQEDLETIASLYSKVSGYNIYICETSGAQPIAWIFSGTYVSKGYITVDKSTTITDFYLEGLDNYDITDITFTVYSNSSCTTKVGTISYSSGSWSTLTVDPGTYYVKESGAPGGYVDISSTVWTVTVSAGETEEVDVTNTSVYGSFYLDKYDSYRSQGSNAEQGDATIEGAVYRVYYYEATSGITATNYSNYTRTRRWYYETASNGYINFASSDYIYSGSDYTSSDFYWNNAGTQIKLPIGTYIIQEVSASEGYLKDTNTYCVVMTNTGSATASVSITAVDSDGNSVTSSVVASDNSSKVYSPEVVKRGGLKIMKYDLTTLTAQAQGNTDLSGFVFTVYNASDNSVYITDDYVDNEWVTLKSDGDGWYTSGQSIMTLTTDEDGFCRTDQYTLPYGTYKVVETSTPSGWYNGSRSSSSSLTYTIEVTANGTYYYVGTNTGGGSNGAKSSSTGGTGFYDQEYRGGISVQKYDYDSELALPQGDVQDLSGFVYTIYNLSTNSVYVTDTLLQTTGASGATIKSDSDHWYTSGTTYSNAQAICTLTTNSSGYASTGKYALPYGTYLVKETSAPEGYMIGDGSAVEEYTITITKDGVIYEVGTSGHSTSTKSNTGSYDYVKRGGITVYKYDNETKLNEELGGADFVGTVFKVVNSSTNDVYVPESRVEDSDWIIYDPDEVGQQENYTSAKQIYDEDGWFAPGEVIMYIIVHEEENDDGTIDIVATTDGNWDGECYTLPYGHYTITEIDTYVEKGYYMGTDDTNSSNLTVVAYLNDGIDNTGTFKDGTVVVCGQDYYTDGIYDQVLRGDFTLSKVDTNYQVLANVVFRIDALDKNGNIIETHYFVTDENGVFNSSWSYTSHTVSNANKNDDYVTENSDGTYTVDEDNISSAYGIWFGVGTKATESLCCLPFGTYQITEIETSVNEGYNMISKTIYIGQKDGSHGNDSYDVYDVDEDSEDHYIEIESEISDLGTLVDLTQRVYTTALGNDGENKSQFMPAADGITLQDTLVFESVTKTDYYEVTTILMDASTGEAYVDEDGNIYEKTITIKNEVGDLTKTFTFTNVNLTGAEGKQLVFYTYIYDMNNDGELYYSITDLTNRDETIYVAEITTEALDSETGLHVADSKDSITITDTVSFSNIEYGVNYLMVGVLYDTETGKPLVDNDGNIITARTYFKTDSTNSTITYEDEDETIVCSGEVTLSFTLNTEDLDGKTIVAYEYLYYRSGSYLAADMEALGYSADTYGNVGMLIAWEEDIANEEQTIHIPAMSTVAIDTSTGDAVGNAVTETGIKDTVSYENVVAGYNYKLVGTVVDYSSGSALTYTGETEFTPNQSSGTVTVSISGINADQGDTYVVYMIMYVKGTDGEWHVVCNHEYIEDESETIHYPDLSTLAFDIETADDVGTVESSATVVDTVQFSNVIPGMEYTVTGTLYKQETGKILNIDGTTFTVSTTFTVNSDGSITVSDGEDGEVTSMDDDGYAASGTVTVTFTGIDSTQLAGESVVVYQVMTHNDVDVAVHEDIYDPDETVHYPYIDTEAYDYYTGDHVGTVFGRLVNGIRKLLGDDDVDGDGVVDECQGNLIDTVTLENLVPGRTYTLTGILYDEETGEAYEQDGGNVTSTVTFTVSEDGSKLTVESGEWYSYTIDNYDSTYNTLDATIKLAFSIDTSQTEGMTIVVYEYLYHDNAETGDPVLVVSHTDITDEDQTIHYPEVHTHAADYKTYDHVGTSSETAEIIDEVQLTNLIIGEEYTVTGYPVYSEDFTDSDGNYHAADTEIEFDKDTSTYTKTFTATAEEMTITLTYVVDSTLLEGTTAVVYEDLYHNDILVNSHHDIESEEQSIYYPKVETNAVDEDTEDDVGAYTEDGTIIDTVTLTNLYAGMTYTLTGVLYDQDSGDILEADGETFTKSITISVGTDGSVTISDSSETYEIISFDEDNGSLDMTVTITFTGINTTVLSDHTAVAYEYLYHSHQDCEDCWMSEDDDGAGDILVADHTEILDIIQAVHYPSVDTLAYDYYTGDHVGTVFGSLVNGIRKLLGDDDVDDDGVLDDVQNNLLDTVMLTNLVPGRTYTLYGIVMDEHTEEAMVVNGETITREYTFTVSEDGTKLVFDGDEPDDWEVTETDLDRNRISCTITMQFSIDTSQTAGWTATVYEYLYHETTDETLVGVHTEIDDEDQQVSYIEVKTHAVDSETLDHVGTSSETATIIDTVQMQNLVIGEEYTVTGTLYYKEDFVDVNGVQHYAGDALEFDESASTYTVTFTATKEEEEVDLTYVIDSTLLEGTTIVVFEDVYHNGIRIIRHNDLEADEQSVYYPEIHTNAVDYDTTDDVGAYTEDGTIVDTVTFTNLLAGMTYVVKGTLYDQSDGSVLYVNGESITAETTIYISKDGTVSCSDGETITRTSYDEETGAVCGTVTVTFKNIDTTYLPGETAVVYERLYHTHQDCDEVWMECWMTKTDDDAEEVLVCDHTELLDELQTIHYPDLETTALDTATGTHVGSIWGRLINLVKNLFGKDTQDEQSIVDTVQLINLVPGRTYTVTGVLMDQGTEDALLIDGEEVTQTATFTVSEDGQSLTLVSGEGTNLTVTEYDEERNYVNGTIDLTFTFDSSLLENEPTTIVAFERLYHNDTLVAVHTEIDDESQSVNEVSVTSTAIDADTGDQVGKVSYEDMVSTITDTVEMEKLVLGEEYTVVGYLIDQNNSTTDQLVYITNADGTDITSSVTFTASADDENFTLTSDDDFDASGSVQLTFTFQNELVQGKAVTVVTEIYHNGVLITVHGYSVDEDGNFVIDASESVYYPTGKTNATDVETEAHLSNSEADTTITDLVYFQNLILGEEYTITGTLYYAEDFTDEYGVTHLAGDEVVKIHTWEADVTDLGSRFECSCGETFDTYEEATAHQLEYYTEEELETLDEEAEHYVCGVSGAAIYTYTCSTCGETITAEEYEAGEYGSCGETSYTSSVTFTAAEEIENATDVVVTTLADGTQVVSGYIPVTFTVDTSLMAGATIVAFEDFIHKGVVVFTHADITDTPEMIRIPDVHTNAHVEDLDEADVYNADGTYATITITDTVSYSNLWTVEELEEMHEAGLTILGGKVVDLRDGQVYDIQDEAVYTLKATLIVKETGEVLTNSAGEEVVLTQTFTATSEDGEIDIDFELDLNDFLDDDGNCYLEGITIVAYEELYYGSTTDDEKKIGEHKDLEDDDQDIRFPKGRTHANDLVDSDTTDTCETTEEGHEHEVNASTNVQIIDKVAYENLHGGTTYYITGTLRDKDTGEVVTDDNGEVIVSTTVVDSEGNVLSTDGSFATDGEYEDEVDGYVYLLFEFSGECLAGTTTVVFENITREGQSVITHADLSDAAQTIHFPEIGTTAGYIYKGEELENFHLALSGEEIALYDIVEFTNLKAGEVYTISGVLMDKDSGAALTDSDGNEITSTVTFMVNEDGSVTIIESSVDDYVETEDTEEDTTEEAEEDTEESEDEDLPTLSYVLANYDIAYVVVGEGTDEIPAGNYTVTDGGYLLEGDDSGTVYEIPDELITAVYITYETVTAIIVTDETDDIPAGTYYLTDEGYVYAGDDSGTVYDIPDDMISSTVTETVTEPIAFILDSEDTDEDTSEDDADTDDSTDDSEDTEDTDDTTESDDTDDTEESEDAEDTEGSDESEDSEESESEDGEEDSEEESEVTANEDYIGVSGTVELIFILDSSMLAGNTIVAFEYLYAGYNSEGKELDEHTDIEDEKQSVHIPDLATTASDADDGDNEAWADEKVTIIDEVAFENLIAGKTYTVKGILYDQSTGSPLEIDGNYVTSTTTFTALAEDGTVEMTFTFNGTNLGDTTLVVFEYLYYEDVLIGMHADIEDEAQSVLMVTPNVQTGDFNYWYWLIFAAIVAFGSGAYFTRRKRQKYPNY